MGSGRGWRDWNPQRHDGAGGEEDMVARGRGCHAVEDARRLPDHAEKNAPTGGPSQQGVLPNLQRFVSRSVILYSTLLHMCSSVHLTLRLKITLLPCLTVQLNNILKITQARKLK
jgi:hypothetical protein